MEVSQPFVAVPLQGLADLSATEQLGIGEAVDTADREVALLKEYEMLKGREPSGVYVLPSITQGHIWQGIVFVRSGMFEGASIRFRMDLSTYPAREPRVTILTKLLHPQIDVNGNTVLTLPDTVEGGRVRPHLWEVINAIKRLFYRVDDDRAVNAEAMQLYTNDKNAFFKLAREAAELSSANVCKGLESEWDINLPLWDPQTHEEHLQRLMTGIPAFDDPATSTPLAEGLSFVDVVGDESMHLSSRLRIFSRR